jgi:hypothetical protein
LLDLGIYVLVVCEVVFVISVELAVGFLLAALVVGKVMFVFELIVEFFYIVLYVLLVPFRFTASSNILIITDSIYIY